MLGSKGSNSKHSKTRSHSNFRPTPRTSASGEDSDDEVVLRLSLKGIRDRRNKHGKEFRVSGEDGSIVSGSTRRSTNSRSTRNSSNRQKDRSVLSKKVSYSDNRSDGGTNSIVANSVNSRQSAGTSSNKAMMGEEQTINKLILEDLWSEDANIVEKGLKQLSGILGVKKTKEHAARNRDVIFRAGGHLAIVQAMKKHRGSDAVQGEGCRALGIAAEEIADSGNENAIATVGGLDAILTAMRAYREDEQIQDFGCGALQNLTGLEENSQILLDREGLTAVLIAMRSFPDSTLIQESGCWTIVNLCQRRENRAKIEKARCLSTIASVIDNHPRCNTLKAAAEEALRCVLELIVSRKSDS